MAHFELVHGAAHGAWCWRDLVPCLQDLGHTAQAIDMPGHGEDRADIESVSLADYGNKISKQLQEPSILVGHSMGGYSITAAAENDPSLISRLVYLCAYTPWPGMSLAQMRMQADEQPLLPLIRASQSRKSFYFDTSGGTDNFYHDCPDESIAYALARLCPESTAASNTALELSERSQSLSRSYIICTQDRAIPPKFQQEMAARFATEDVHSLDSSHSPFFSMPKKLAQLLDMIARKA